MKKLGFKFMEEEVLFRNKPHIIAGLNLLNKQEP